MEPHYISKSLAIGLTKAQIARLRKTFGNEHHIASHTGLSSALKSKNNPLLFWISARVMRDLAALPTEQSQRIEDTPKVLLLEPGYVLADFEMACDLGIDAVVRYPVGKERLMNIMRLALERQNFHSDVECMSREIGFERDKANKKNSILSFFISFLGRPTENIEVEELLQNAFTDIGQLFPVVSLHAALRQTPCSSISDIGLYIAAPENSAACQAWKQALLEHASRSSSFSCALLPTKALRLDSKYANQDSTLPDNKTLLCRPLICDEEMLGILLIQPDSGYIPGREHSLALDLALRHLSLTIKNMRRFKLLQMHADYDVLTMVHSRRHFEGRIEEEMQRFTRYREPFSMIMLDIDGFKHINDSYGHLVGDLILREVAAILSASIRNTDYCARYGGEEFAVLLPHTDGKKAHALAERIRRRISKHSFCTGSESNVKVTVSLGVANITDTDNFDKHTLLGHADMALYTAKSSGKNRTCTFVHPLSTVEASSVAAFNNTFS